MSRTQQTKQATPAPPLATLGETERWEVIEEIARSKGLRFEGYYSELGDPRIVFAYKRGKCYLDFDVRLTFNTTEEENHQLTADELITVLNSANQIAKKMAQVPIQFGHVSRLDPIYTRLDLAMQLPNRAASA
jgi:hypothetical protein